SAVLQAAQTAGRPVLVSDRKDPVLASVDNSDLASALCVPIQNAEQGLVGWLYADDPRPEAFTVSDRVQWESYGRELGRSLRQAEPVAPVSQTQTSAPPPPAVLAAVAGLFLLLLLGWGLTHRSNNAPVDQPTAAVTVPGAEAVEVARSFHQLLRLREFHQAWELLSERLQEKMPEDRFRQGMSEWLANETNRWELQYRKVASSETRDDRIKVVVEPGPDVREAKTWTWTMVATEQGWRLDWMDGPLNGPR
ncbi:MAG: hypothetical protein KC910_32705, partial [Candidatus Eremiobacteraeota bacterium]|nr:hypothetical protein [Candidatus Eremiobacteraeota bacterium]